MKKLVTATLMLFQTVAYANSKYMKNSEEVIKHEKEVIFPEIIFSMYKYNLSDRKDNLKIIIEDYNNNKIKLENLIIEFDNLYKNIVIDEIVSFDEADNLRNKIDRLSSLKSTIRNSMFEFRESELRIRKIDKSLDNYCEESNLIFDSKEINLHPLIAERSIYLDDRYTSDILRMGVAAILEIKFKRRDMRNIEYWSVNESLEFHEAKNWYYKNTWVKQPQKIKELALSICKNLPSEFVLTEEQVKNKEFIFNFVSHLKGMIDSSIQSIDKFYNNKVYTTDQLKALIDRLNYLSGDIDLNELKRFDDKLTLFYIFMDNEINRLKNDVKNSVRKFIDEQAIKESDSYKEKSRQYENLSRARSIFYQDILHKSSQDLLKIYLNYQNNCKEYITQKQVLYAKIDSDVKKMRENYENDYNRNDPFFRNIDNKVSILKDENNKRQQKICNK
ncbi:hypothetical protein [Spirobacillus cienkowskii]|uniref:hypothetical protein n=1 Tax=Spirobacillus cienkowskii TaxID=495820 RepID=UPI0030CD429E